MTLIETLESQRQMRASSVYCAAFARLTLALVTLLLTSHKALVESQQQQLYQLQQQPQYTSNAGFYRQPSTLQATSNQQQQQQRLASPYALSMANPHSQVGWSRQQQQQPQMQLPVELFMPPQQQLSPQQHQQHQAAFSSFARGVTSAAQQAPPSRQLAAPVVATSPDSLQDRDDETRVLQARNTQTPASIASSGGSSQLPKAARHILSQQSSSASTAQSSGGAQLVPSGAFRANLSAPITDLCADRLCYGLPMNCAQLHSADNSGNADLNLNINEQANNNNAANENDNAACNILVTSKRFVNPSKPAARDIFFELIARASPEQSSYAAVGFSESGRMSGFVSECLQYRDAKAPVQIVQLKHSFNVPGYVNVPVHILSGIKSFGVSYVNGYYQCRWAVESAVEFSFEAPNGTLITRREDLGFKNYHILLATGEYDETRDTKLMHTTRIASLKPVSLAQTGQVRSLGAHLLIRIHGSLMVCIWVGLVSLSILSARYYKHEWSTTKINNLAIWFVIHRSLMLLAWFGSIVAVIFAYMYTETYNFGIHQLSGSTCLLLSTLQVCGGLLRPSNESSKRVYFNWAHFAIGNLSYLFAIVALITASFLSSAHLPILYTWIVVSFVIVYTFFNLLMTGHQYIMHKSSKISITTLSDLNTMTSSTKASKQAYSTSSLSTSARSSSTLTTTTSSSSPNSNLTNLSNNYNTESNTGFVLSDFSCKEKNSPFRQFIFGIFVTVIVLFITILVTLVNYG